MERSGFESLLGYLEVAKVISCTGNRLARPTLAIASATAVVGCRFQNTPPRLDCTALCCMLHPKVPSLDIGWVGWVRHRDRLAGIHITFVARTPGVVHVQLLRQVWLYDTRLKDVTQPRHRKVPIG